jgi:hypothetical protein
VSGIGDGVVQAARGKDATKFALCGADDVLLIQV